MNIAVIMGGNSPERNVSLTSGGAVATALMANGHNVRCIDPALGASCVLDIATLEIPNRPPSDEELAALPLRNYLLAINSSAFDEIEIVFSVLHGKNGEDGVMQALLEARGLKYTGSKVLGSAVAMDKVESKILMTATNIPTPQWAVVKKNHVDDFDLLKEIRDTFRSGMVIKPNDQGSTVGMTILEHGNLDDVQNAIKEALNYSNIALVENYIPGRELTVAVVGDEAFPIVEIAPEGGFYDYQHKYTKGMSNYICPAEIDEELTDFIQHLAVTAHKVCGCHGYSRVDFRLDEDNHPWCLEVNTLPGMTSTSLVPKAAAAAGIEFGELCERIIALA